MSKLIFIITAVAYVFIASFTASAHMMNCGYGKMGHGMHGKMHRSMIRHHYAMRHGIGSEYSSMKNILAANEENFRSGRLLYDKNCSRCHGQSGCGDGEAGKELNPRPAKIANISKMPMATDGYLFWTIAEGGAPIQTAMPAFKSSLTEEEIWEIILYLRDM